MKYRSNPPCGRARRPGRIALVIESLAVVVFAAAVLAAVASPGFAQLPAARLGSIYPAGARAGQTVEVTITGADLDGVDRLTFSHAGIKAVQKTAEPGPFDEGPQPVENQFVVTVAANVPVGVHEARAVGKYGMSNPRAFSVGDIAETGEIEPNNQASEATEVEQPTVINGRSNAAGDIDYYCFQAAAGQRITVAGYARRIDSPLDSVITVYDPQGRQLGSSRDALEGDSLVDFRARSAGRYVIEIHDAAYQGGPDYVYRVHVGVLPVIDFVFPPAAAAGGNRRFTIYGRNLPRGQNAGLTVDGAPLQKLTANIALPGGAAAQALKYDSLLEPAAAALDAVEYRVKSPLGSSNPVLVGVAAATPVEESEPNNAPDQAQQLKAPCEVMGQFYPARDRDWFRFDAKQGESFGIEVIAQRMGVHANPSLMVERVVKPAEGEEPEQTQQLGYVFDSARDDGGPEFDIRHDDPVFRFTAPDDGTYRILVRDAYADVASDPRHVYRLALYNGQPDFRLAAVAEGSHSAVLLRKGGQVGIRVVAFRRDGFDGEIELAATNLPPGVSATGAILGPEQHHTMIVLSAAANAKDATGLIQVVGKAKVGASQVMRTARFGTALAVTQQRNQNATQLPAAVDGRIARDLAVSVTGAETSPLSDFQAGGGKVWETSRGGKLKIPVSRGGAFKGRINFVPRGLPANVNAPAAAINPNQAAAEFQVDLRSNTPTGTYTFYLDAIAEQVEYVRNPEAAAAAAERKKEVDQLKTKADADAKAATTAKAAADKRAAEATAAVQQATQAKTAAEQAVAAAVEAAQSAAQQAAQAKSAAAANKDDANLAQAAAAAQKAADDAAAKVKDGMATLVAAEKALEAAAAEAGAAAEAQAEAEMKAAEATRLAEAAAQLKAKADKLATDTANAAKPKKLNVPLVSTPVTLKIAPAPITLAEPRAATVKQGAKVEVPLAITRLFNFKDQVNLQAIVPSGVGGLSIPSGNIPANQTAGKLAITAASNATEGQHTLTVRASMNLNGQGLTVEQPLILTVQKVETK